MLEIFEEIKIRYLILFSFIIDIAIVIGEESGFIIKNKDLRSGLSDTLIIFWIIFMVFKHKGNYKLNFSILKEKSVMIDMIKVLVYHLVFAIGAGQLFTAIIYIIKPTWMNEVLNNTPLTGSMYTDFILGVILAPILEELIFRGVLFSRFNKKWSFGAAAIISSILFGMLHIEMAIVGAVTFGLCQCILFKKYDNIAVPITVHFINNFFCILMTGIFRFIDGSVEEDKVTELVISSGDITTNLVIGIVFLVPSTILIVKFIKNNWPKKEELPLEMEYL